MASHDLNLGDSDHGQILTNGDGFTLYMFTNDDQGANASACMGDCLAMWPAVPAVESTGDGLDADLVGSFERSDGAGVQATYNGWPLYTFVNDKAPGDLNGQGMKGIWWILNPAGNALGPD